MNRWTYAFTFLCDVIKTYLSSRSKMHSGLISVSIFMFIVFCSPTVMSYDSAGVPQNMVELTYARRCERITVPQCSDMPYNYTFADFSVVNGASDQRSAEIDMLNYMPMVLTHCSPYVRFFLCLRFVPLCSTSQKNFDHKPIYACRHLCETVKKDCEHTLKLYQQTAWPVQLDCNVLVENGLCVTEKTARDYTVAPPIMRYPHGLQLMTLSDEPMPTVSTVFECPDGFVRVSTRAESAHHCVPICETDVHFQRRDKYLLQIFMLLFTVLGFLTTSFMALTACISFSRFQYPERPAVWIAVSFMGVTVGYFVRLILGSRHVSCSTTNSSNEKSHLMLWSLSGFGNGICMLQFVLVYYFFHAGCLWCVMLAMSWFLSACQKWSPEAFSSLAKCYHVIAWIFPVLLTLGAIVWQKVDASELSGMCGVGNLNREGLLVFVIIPTVAYLLTGGTCAVSGLISAVRIRAYFDPLHRKRFSILMWRICFFCGAFILSLSVLVACSLAKYLQWTKDVAKAPRIATGILFLPPLIPLFLAMMTGCWVFNKKTIKCWTKLCKSFVLQTKKDTDVEPTCSISATGPLLRPDVTRTPWQSLVGSSVASHSAGTPTWTHTCTYSANI